MIETSVDKIKSYLQINWDNKLGLLASFTLILILYFTIINFFEPTLIGFKHWKIYCISLIPIFLFIYVIWIFSTNRFFINKPDAIYVGIILNGDSTIEKVVVKKIINKVVGIVNEEYRNHNIIIKPLPVNFCPTRKSFDKYFYKNQSNYHVLLGINAESGNYDSIEKIKIVSIWSSFNTIDNQQRKKIFSDYVDYIKDIGFQMKVKNWEYNVSQSGVDKNKYFANFKDLILFYTSLYCIGNGKYLAAIDLLEPLYDPAKGKLEIFKEKNKLKFKLSPISFAQGRISSLLINLFLRAAGESYEKGETELALNVLINLENLVKHHKNKYIQYISMARFFFETGNIEKAKIYNEKASLVNPKGSEIYINYGFFAICENDSNEFANNYYKVYKKRRSCNLRAVDIIDFLEKYSGHYPDSIPLFQFAIGFLHKFFINNDEGDELIKNSLSQLKDEEHIKLNSLADKVLRIKNVSKKSSKKRKKRRKKKR